MHRWRTVCLLLGILLLTLPAWTTAQGTIGFDPVISTIGFSEPRADDNAVQWSVTVSNVGDAAGRNVTIVDTLPTALRIEDVRINTGTASIDGQTVTVVLPELAPDATVQFAIHATAPDNPFVSNTACVTADNLPREECASSLPVQALPATGEQPSWRQTLMLLGVLALATSLVMFTLAGAGLRAVLRE